MRCRGSQSEILICVEGPCKFLTGFSTVTLSMVCNDSVNPALAAVLGEVLKQLERFNTKQKNVFVPALGKAFQRSHKCKVPAEHSLMQQPVPTLDVRHNQGLETIKFGVNSATLVYGPDGIQVSRR